MKRLALSITLLVTISIVFQGFVLAGMLGGRSREGMTVQPTGAAIWDVLKQMDYAKNWKMWPGKTSLYPGKNLMGHFSLPT